MKSNQCPFEKAIISTSYCCIKSRRYAIAEREGVECGDLQALSACKTLVSHLRNVGKFNIKRLHESVPISHGQEMKIKCGGLNGLQGLIAPRNDAGICDIHTLVAGTIEYFGALDKVPYQRLVKDIASYKLRQHKT